jgi:hypothetical protein
MTATATPPEVPAWATYSPADHAAQGPTAKTPGGRTVLSGWYPEGDGITAESGIWLDLDQHHISDLMTPEEALALAVALLKVASPILRPGRPALRVA